MKKCISKILAGVIALAMILGNFTGMGMVAHAAPTTVEDLVVKAVDEHGKGVQGVYLMLDSTEDDEDYDIVFDDPTDGNGEVTIEQITDDPNAMGEFYLKPTDDSGYTTEDSVKISFGQNGIKVNEYAYAGQAIEIHVESSGGNQPAKPHIDSATSSISEANRNGDTATITVKGTSLPEKLCYQIWYKAKNNVENNINAITSVQTTGTDTERRFNVSIPAISAYPNIDIVQWAVKVIEKEDPKLSDAWTRVNINIKSDTVTAETKSALQTAVNEIDSLTESDYSTGSWSTYKAAVDVAKPLLTKQDATNTECQAAIQAIGKAKAALVLKRDLATESTKFSLQAAVDKTLGLNGSDYTAASWKAFSAAVAKGKSLLANADATETQCQEAIREIERTKAALVIAKVNVSNITISGLSKTIAMGKKIQLTAKVSPANATNKTVKWTTSNKKYATVDSKGMVSVKKAGAGKTVTITAAATDGSGKKAAYKIKIMKNAVKSIKLKAAKSVKAGKSLKVKATVKTSGKKANKTLKWTSSNTKYATVSSKGVVKTKKAGKGKKVKITAMSTDGSNKKKSVTVTIK